MNTPPLLNSPTDRPEERAPLTPTEWIALVRAQGLGCDQAIVEQIDQALAAADDDHDVGLLHVARALALQCRGDATEPAAAARDAVPHLVAAGEMQTAAFASAMAAVFLDQSGEPVVAADHAVDALVMLGDIGSDSFARRLDVDGVRAALALSGFFMRLSAFDLAVGIAQRAFQSGLVIDGIPIDTLAYSAGYLAVEGAHVTDDDDTRERYVALALQNIEWLERSGTDDVSRIMLSGGLRAEALHAQGNDSTHLDLDAATSLYDDASPDFVAWHQLVRGESAHRQGDARSSIELFDQAIPGLEASSDNHCLVRALRSRAEARAAVGDFAGAYADATDLAERTRRWQVDQVGRLAFQLARRADLERLSTELRITAARLADDIDSDATTGVRSRRWLERRLDELTASDGCGLAMMCDIDHFKTVNDTYGHHVGDDVLFEFGRLLRRVAGDADVARFGGEEFVIVLRSDDPTAGSDVAERLRCAVEEHDWDHIAPGLRLTISCGATFGNLRDLRALLIAADDALLDAKHRGRNLVVSPLGSGVPHPETPRPPISPFERSD